MMTFRSRNRSPRERALADFQKLRRYQDASSNGYVRCVSCLKPMPVKEAQGGHLVSRRVRATELERDNVWPQCPRCNGPLSGNVIAYRSNLVKMIGEPRVKRIEDMANASEGDEEAMGRLDDKDKRAVVSRKNDDDYKRLSSLYRAATRQQQREKVS